MMMWALLLLISLTQMQVTLRSLPVQRRRTVER